MRGGLRGKAALSRSAVESLLSPPDLRSYTITPSKSCPQHGLWPLSMLSVRCCLRQLTRRPLSYHEGSCGRLKKGNKHTRLGKFGKHEDPKSLISIGVVPTIQPELCLGCGFHWVEHKQRDVELLTYHILHILQNIS